MGITVASCGGGDDPPSPAPPPPSSTDSGALDVVLRDIALDQEFRTDRSDYTATSGALLASTSVTVRLSDSGATATVNGARPEHWVSESSAGIELARGRNLIEVVVTAEDEVTTSTYTFEIERQTEASLAQSAYTKALNPDSNDRFGTALAVSGNTLAVGAPQEDSGAIGVGGDSADDSAEDAGAVYIYKIDPSDNWSLDAYIKATNTESGDGFGAVVALSGDTLAVGAPREDSGAVGVNGDQADNRAEQSGAVYVFERDSGGVWTQQAYIKASNAEAGDGFGTSIALGERFLVVGAPGEDSAATGENGDQSDNSAADAGAVYVFTRDDGGQWPQNAYLKANNTGAGDRFGASVSLSWEADGVLGIIDFLAVGAPDEDSIARGPFFPDVIQNDNDAPDSGAVYVFTRNEPDQASVWGNPFYLKAPNSEALDAFGVSVASKGPCVAIGATGEDSSATGRDGDQADNGATDSGAVYVLCNDLNAFDWLPASYIKAANSEAGDAFSSSIGWGIGSPLVVAAPGEDGSASGLNGDMADNSAPDSGAAFVYFDSDEVVYVKASNPESGDAVSVLAVQGGKLVIAATEEDSNASGVNGDQADNSATDSGAVYVID